MNHAGDIVLSGSSAANATGGENNGMLPGSSAANATGGESNGIRVVPPKEEGESLDAKNNETVSAETIGKGFHASPTCPSAVARLALPVEADSEGEYASECNESDAAPGPSEGDCGPPLKRKGARRKTEQPRTNRELTDGSKGKGKDGKDEKTQEKRWNNNRNSTARQHRARTSTVSSKDLKSINGGHDKRRTIKGPAGPTHAHAP